MVASIWLGTNGINRFIFLFLFFVCSSLSSEKFSMISTLANGKLQYNDTINDIHVIYNFTKDDEAHTILNQLEKLPVTIYFYQDCPSYEFCTHIAKTLCKNPKVYLDMNPDSPDQDLQAACFAHKKPRVSLIASLYNADEFVHDFLKNMVEQSIFSSIELIIINAHSPGNEEKEILPYLKEYPNIIYIRLPHDPGLYAVWNMGIRFAHAPLVGNANLDDRRDLYSLAEQVKALEKHPEYDLAYCDYCVTNKPNDQWYDIFAYQHSQIKPFSKQAIQWCLPGPQPVWRKSIHEKYGYFREDFVSAADQEMWCRAVDQGSEFIKINCFSGIYYFNPKGVSTEVNSPKAAKRTQENSYIWQTYKHLWSSAS